jgi:hypothetical protein
VCDLAAGGGRYLCLSLYLFLFFSLIAMFEQAYLSVRVLVAYLDSVQFSQPTMPGSTRSQSPSPRHPSRASLSPNFRSYHANQEPETSSTNQSQSQNNRSTREGPKQRRESIRTALLHYHYTLSVLSSCPSLDLPDSFPRTPTTPKTKRNSPDQSDK